MSQKPSVRRPASPIDYRLSVLQDVFPESFKENALSASALVEFVGNPQEAQPDVSPGLHWPGRAEAIHSLRRGAASALEPAEGFVGPSSHVFITGENYETMKLLQPAYGAGVKMAYVDPPYNNGYDEIYCDDFDNPWDRYASHLAAIADQNRSPALMATSGRGRHSRWMAMMLPRLYVIRNLLADDGVVFVVIDDHESHRLRFLMDEVFGPENFVCTFVWEKRYSPAPDAPDVGYVHEYILCYRKSSSFEAAFLPMTDEQRARYQNPDDDSRGPWKAADYTCRFTADERENLYYPIRHPGTGKDIWPERSRVWACTQETHERHVAEGRLWWGMNNENTVPARKAFLSEIQGRKPATLLKHDEVGHTDEATTELRRFFPNLKLTPKPVGLVRHLIRISGAEPGDVIFAPFARDGVTADAVIKHNVEDNAGLRFLLIGLPELIEGGGALHTLPEIALKRIQQCLEEAADPSQRLRVFRQRRAVFFPDGSIHDGNDEIDSSTRYFDSAAGDETLAVNIALAGGYVIDGPIERRDLSDGYVAYIFSGGFAVCVSRALTAGALDSLRELGVQRVAFLEAGFAGQDGLLVNARSSFEQHGMSFETV
jgi:adenine-specific DNA-methyltransferase